MTAEVREALPTGRNIQAVGIMIPGTTLAVGGGGALSRDVGGSGNLQQSPLQYRGSGDTVQTIEGIRLNNLCAQGAYSRRLLERRELRRVQLRDRRRLGRNGPGRHARQHGAEATAATASAARRSFNYAGEGFQSDNCGSPGIGLACTRSNLSGQQDVQPEQPHHQRRRDPEDLGRQSVDRRSDRQEQGLVQLHVPEPRLDEDQDRRLLRQEPVAVRLRPGLHQAGPRRRPHHQQRGAHLVAGERQGQDLGLPRQPAQVPQPLGHRGDHSARGRRRAGDADQLRATSRSGRGRTPTSCCSRPASACTTRNTPSSTSRASPAATRRCGTIEAISNSRVYNVVDSSNNRQANAWPNPADHFSVLRTYMGAASYVIGSHSLRGGLNWTQRRLEAADDVDRRRAADHLQRRPPDVGDAAAAVGSQQRHRSRPRPLRAGPLVDGPHHAEPWPALRPVHRRDARELGAAEPPRRAAPRSAIARTARSIRATSAPAWCRTGRTSRRASASRWTCSATAAPRSRRATRATWRARRSRSPTR